MELDDLFGQRRNEQRRGYGQQYGHDDEDDDYRTSQSFNQNSYNQQNEFKAQLLNKLRSNPRLKTLLLIAAIVIVTVVVLIVILLFPLILKLLSYIGENGIQGILDTVWKGTK
jgi:uncharacterized membrane protein YvbJ